ncbi:outer membrane protein OmpK [Pelagicoccus enzymogenes]|uniref:outer membrane protein OmpK n=1 Tax=Pelagicoccus enzymogenes TaxID=2773457 RepID=UPI00280F8086|nr:outer membrane protein OmpK [Pelagicoccus enzymogenes]MDQ8198441.1 outer membrane protein OmpK [Pelagicoccus enzymogenes]
MKRTLLTASATTLFATVALAGDVLLWQDNSLSLLVGGGFELDPDTQQTVTFEHVSGWSKGDLFIFVDGINFDGDEDIGGKDTAYYGEVSPRFNIGKIVGQDFSGSLVNDLYVATTWEFGQNSDDNLLVGLGVDLNLPGFDFFQLNGYRRFNDTSSDLESYQITPVWKITIPVGETELVCDGFIDWVIGEGTDHLHVCPQVKLDVGMMTGMEKGKLYAGIEYDYWKNKYAVPDGAFGLDSNQSTFSGLLKFHF